MCCWNDEHHLVLVDDLDVQAGILDGHGGDTKLHFVVENQFQGLGPLGANNVERHAGVLLFELAEEEGKNVKRGRVIRAYRQGATWQALQVGKHKVDMFQAQETVFGKGFKDSARRSERDFTAATIEKAVAKMESLTT